MRVNKFRRSEANDEDQEEGGWLASFSDLMTDLLAIFVVLFSFAMLSQSYAASRNEAEKQPDLITTGSVLGQTKNNSSSILTENDGILPKQGDKLAEQDSNQFKQENKEVKKDKVAEDLNSYVDEAGMTDELSVMKQGDNTIVLRVAASVLFESGQADINKNAYHVLERLAQVLSENEENIKMIRIEGHTDNVPTDKEEFDTNWELSTSRAVNVLKRILAVSDLKPSKISAVGYAEFQPLADNDTEEGKALNRRVDFIIETVNN